MIEIQCQSDDSPGDAEAWKNVVEAKALRGELWQFNDFTWWLNEATTGLCDEAKALVHEDVHTRYQNSLDDAFASGMQQREAEAYALGSLGHPDAANKRYHRTYLTELAVEGLEKGYCRPSWGTSIHHLLFAFILSVALYTSFFLDAGHMDSVYVALYIVMLSMLVPTNLLAWMLSIKGYLACLYFDLAVKGGMQLTAIAIVLASPWSELSIAIVLLGLSYLFTSVLPFFALRRKIKNTFHARGASIS